jgi:hypothetical protein
VIRRLLALLALLAVAACGVPVSGQAHRVDPSSVPYDLLSTTPPTAPTSAAGPTAQIYLVSGDHLVARSRHITGLNIPAEALRSLLVGPTPAESRHGLTSDVPAQTRLLSLDLNGSVARVDLSPTFGIAGGSQQVLAIAQIVFTVTASHYIDGVTFAVDGRPIDVPNGSGSLTRGVKTRADFRQQGPTGT